MLELAAAWLLAILWLLPRIYAFWTAFHPAEFARFNLLAPLTLDNFVQAWNAAPFARYYLNTFLLVTLILACQLVLCTLAAYAFARLRIQAASRRRLRARAGAADDHARRADRRELPHHAGARSRRLAFSASACPTWRRRSASSCCARPSRACRASSTRRRGSKAAISSQLLWKVYVPLAKPVYIAFGLVSVSFHWNKFLVASDRDQFGPSTRRTVGLSVFASTDQGIDWSIITAATLMWRGAVLSEGPAACARADPRQPAPDLDRDQRHLLQLTEAGDLPPLGRRDARRLRLLAQGSALRGEPAQPRRDPGRRSSDS